MDDTILGEIIRARDGRPSVGNWVKGGSRLVNISRQVDNITGHNLPEEGELRNTAVFKLHILEAAEPLLVGIGKYYKGIKETNRGLVAKLGLKGIQGGGGFSHLGRGKGGGRAREEGSDVKLLFNVLN